VASFASLSVGGVLSLGHSPQSRHDLWLGTGGLVAGWGAPWTDDLLGASVEVGAALLDAVKGCCNIRDRDGLPYAAVSLHVQAPIGQLRPFASGSVARFLQEARGPVGPLVTGALDLGVAWSTW
jgi:hypothetical protein